MSSTLRLVGLAAAGIALGLAAIGPSSLGAPELIAFAQVAPGDDPALVARARAIHDRVITIDTHNDINPSQFTPECNYTQRLTTQVNLPKMNEGGLDVSFMIAYVGQGPLTPEGFDSAYAQAVAKFNAVHVLTEQLAPNQVGLALTPDDVRRIAASGRKVAVIGVENGYSIGTDIGRVKEFWERGARYMSLAHNGHSQLADSNTGEATGLWLNGGVSPLGKLAIAEMNRWGIMVDVSHPSKAANLQAIALSKAPVIASHSSARALADHSRNLDDETLWAIKQNGGVVQAVAFASYVRVPPPERQAAIAALNQEFGIAATPGGRRGGGAGGGNAGAAACPIEAPGTPAIGRGGRGGGGAAAAIDALTPEQRAQYDRRMMAINARLPVPPRATVKDFVDHIDYLVKYIGIDHVGIASDFDGGGGIDGWNSASETFNVTLELVRRGYTEEEIGKIWGGNLLRVWGEVERVAKGIQGGTIK